ncbi:MULTISPECIES: tetratricopeptide repeat protein [unclassified Leptolyngbya]|uniref:tetratricopeptide repeat protein n=1 Tax=unclassified Leptolyngbya TaxID=2650499 RepID=UPI001685FEB9|nr:MULTISPECIES: tetratricopeptide repeat protein [unclassified Leptolyngbya]MBD1911647.1 tetratricopeptide repeat protein [Leptolyngbya sp. FACHB-8]MBD2157845.1 tetratricopeptide repeat protein [Leptolyngbya sp. FACHB-16]
MVEQPYPPSFSLSLEECQQRLQNPHLSTSERTHLLCRLATLHLQRGNPTAAITTTEQALQLQPDSALAYYYRGLALEHLGQLQAALAAYDRAIALTPQPSAQWWCDRGNALRGLGRYKESLHSYDQALEIAPAHEEAMGAKGSILALLGRRREALQMCDRVLEHYPSSAQAWNSKGVVLITGGRLQPALGCFDQAIALNGNFDRAWCNRGSTLMRLGHTQEGINSLDTALSIQPESREYWKANGLTYRGYGQMKLGLYEEAIVDFDQALEIKPGYPLAALYRFVTLVQAGEFFRHLSHRQLRPPLLRNLGIIFNTLKYRLGILVGLILLLGFGQGAWVMALRQVLPALLSLGVVAVVVADLWRYRLRLGFVRQTYFHKNPLIYLRAFCTVVLTLFTYTVTDAIAPAWMRWGWANWVFGQPGNIIFQPFNLFSEQTGEAIAVSYSPSAPLLSTAGLLPFDGKVLLILGFWLVLILGIPFWSSLEERIFRRGADSWRQIGVRSTQFGLIHLLAGIPILGGFVLILPGFLFAWRYKFVRDRHFRKTGDTLQAQEAGVAASTADHAIYNAILITLAVGSILAFGNG